MSFDILSHSKGWSYKKKSEKIAEYLKDRVREYPASPIKKDMFLAECSYDLGYKKADFESYLNVLEQLGIVEMTGEMIVSVTARERAEAQKRAEKKETFSDVVEDIMK